MLAAAAALHRGICKSSVLAVHVLVPPSPSCAPTSQPHLLPHARCIYVCIAQACRAGVLERLQAIVTQAAPGSGVHVEQEPQRAVALLQVSLGLLAARAAAVDCSEHSCHQLQPALPPRPALANPLGVETQLAHALPPFNSSPQHLTGSAAVRSVLRLPAARRAAGHPPSHTAAQAHTAPTFSNL